MSRLCLVLSLLVAVPARAAFEDDFPFAHAVNAGPVLNSDAGDYHPTITAGGNTMAFASQRTGGFGNWDIWVATRVAGVWQEPVHLELVNWAGVDQSPAITPDGSTIFFASDRDGTWELWRTDWSDGAYQAPTKLPTSLNIGTYNIPNDVSPDGVWLYYSPGNSVFSLYRIDLTSYDSGSGEYLVVEGPIQPPGSQYLMCLTPDFAYGLVRTPSGSQSSSPITGGVFGSITALGEPFQGIEGASSCTMPGDASRVYVPYYQAVGGFGGWDIYVAPSVPTCSINSDCDDAIACTSAVCVSGQCSYTLDHAGCDNGLFCDGAEYCDLFAGCQSYDAPCDDGISCTDDGCDEAGDACTGSVANDANCDNGLYCDGDETCDAVSDCQPGTAVVCDDGVGCTDDSCNEGTDSCDFVANDANCDDGAYCNGAEICDLTGDCQTATAIDCDDGVGCTDDSCNEGTDQCDNVVSDANCDDGAFCNGVETCNATGDCQAGTSPCNDGVGCTDDSCDESGDTCSNVANDANCDDGAFCNGSETCDATGDCQTPAPIDCNDGVGCTDDSCNEGTDSCDNVANDANCDDGAFCNGAETCDGTGDCQTPAPIDCDDGVGCTDDSCNEGTDSCDNVANDANCDNGLFCDGTETCDGTGDCQSGTTVDCDDGVGCTDDTCNEGTDQCDNVANDANCDDGAFCNGVETCDSTNDCQSGTTVDCDDGVGCTDDTCNETTDACDNAINHGNCDNGTFCDGAEACDPTNDCQVGGGNPCSSPTVCDETADVCTGCLVDGDCDDGVDCTTDTCNAGTCEHVADDASCSDGAFCNGYEACDLLLDCQAASAPACSVDDTCDETNDLCIGPCGDGSLDPSEGCDDGNTVAGDGCSPTCTEEDGFICDTSTDPSVCAADGDGDGIADESDNCPALANADQADTDGDGVGDACQVPQSLVVRSGGCGCNSASDGPAWMLLLLVVAPIRR